MSNICSLEEYLKLLLKQNLVLEYDIEDKKKIHIEYVSCNSKDIKTNTLFICKGAHFREEFLKDAIISGAVCYISENKYELGNDCSYIIVNDIRKAMAYISNYFYNKAWEKLNLVGITGTKGKSTTTYFIRYIFDEYLKSINEPMSGVISSIDTYDGVIDIESHITTPESIDLHKHFDNAVRSGMKYMEMEVSSQALKYNRVLGIEFNVGCFLNIGYDHVSDIEHKDFDDYFSSKLRIFEQSKISCINLNTEHLEEVLKASKKCSNMITFGLDKKEADVYGYGVRKKDNNILFRARTKRFDKEFQLTIPGLFNVENALAAIAICEALDIPEKYIYEGLKKAKVKGRMEVYNNEDNKVIAIVDYAHNKLSFERLFESVKAEYPERKITTVFGCPGKKALDRRKDLGEISGKYSDTVIITEEDPGEESVVDICNEISKYIKAQGCNYSIVTDRGKAIEKAIMDVDEDSVILITGKGDETRQKRGLEYIDCPSDVDYTKEFLYKYDNRLFKKDRIKKF
ncbi:UDP-N-acetylmuramoyl-L-alanyl-D-glutamate--2,6-diaminopimelate ligase [Clostridium paraputrificum]|uniref:Mur ligase family protein n=1 Tax=Clostridium paraputrificum TaxID=29363 RepID=UPI000EA0BB43|nr:UDP-N-acetylmuramoyl-L-alanyl-D-glutamate--2,6-diaminopimelate ligase [Clostridium paraputrificum]RKI45862.1 UDP-N-acetylmuramoyl-L-alanyl-D-glutamate--2,6-diaminopimelate ligase [Clostridium paraputrificum]